MDKNNPLSGAYHKVHFLREEGYETGRFVLSESAMNNIEESGVCSDEVVTFRKGLTQHHVSLVRPPSLPAELAPSQAVVEDICEVNFIGHTYYFGVIQRQGMDWFDGVFLKVMDKTFDSKIGHVFAVASEKIRIGINGRGTINLNNLSPVIDLAFWRLI